MGVSSSPSGMFPLNTGLPHQTPDDLRTFKNEVDARLSGAAPLGSGANFNEPAQYNFGETAAVFRGADGTHSVPVVPTKPGVVLQFFRKNASSIGVQLGFYQMGVLNVATDFYGLYQYSQFSADLSGSSGQSYQNHGLRSYLALDHTNVGTNFVYGYSGWIEVTKNVPMARAVGLQVEANNSSGTDDLVNVTAGINSSAALVFSSAGNAHASTHIFFEGPSAASASYTGMYIQQNSMVRHIIDARGAIFNLQGTITATEGSATLTGVGTKFISELVAGDQVLFLGTWFTIASNPVSNTSATMTSIFGGTTQAFTEVIKTVVPLRMNGASYITATDVITGLTDYRLIGLNGSNFVSIDADAKGTVLGGTLAIGRSAPLSTTSVHVVGPNNAGGLGSGVGVVTIESNDALAADIGGSIAFRGIFTGTSTAGFGGIKAGKANATDGNLDTYLALYARSHAGGILERVRIDAAGQLQSPSYVSQTTAWAITAAGGADFRYIYTDELHAKSFIADLEQALAGGQIISKSVAELNSDFTLPAAGGVGTLVIKDLPSASGMAVFQSGDIIRLRQFSRAAGALTIGDAWGVVTGFVNNGDGTQNWTFTRSTGAQAGTASGTINGKTLALDYGTTGNGIYEVNAIDGAYGINSPYSQIVTWATHPQNGQTIRTRTGNLVGITGATEFGLYAGDGGIAAANKFVRISDVNFEVHNIGLQLYESSTLAMSLQPSGPYFALGNPMPASYLQASTSGIWMGHTGSSVYKMRVGTTSAGGALTAGWSWDNAVLTIIGSVTATAGAIGGFSIGADYVRDAADSFGLASTVTGGDDVRFWAGSAFASRATAPFRITESGAGSIAGWSITSTDIRNSAATVMLRGAGNLAFGTVPPTSASAGTGLFLDGTGMYGLLANVVQAKFDAATGAITAGAGAVVLSASGLSIANGSTAANTLRFLSGSDVTARLLNVFVSGVSGTELRSEIPVSQPTGLAQLLLTALNDNNSGTAVLEFRGYGTTHATNPDSGYAILHGGNFKGLSIGTTVTATLPAASAILDLNTTTGALLVSRLTTTQKNALTPTNGMVAYDSTLAVLQGYIAGAWTSLGAGGGSGANTALSNLSAVAINAALVLGTSDAFALGSTTKQWSDLFLAVGGVINWDNGDTVLSHFEHQLTVSGARVLIPSAPPALAGLGLLMLGAGPFDGSTAGFFTGLAAGTHLAVNAASASTADLAHFQVAGVPKFKIGANGSTLFQNLVRVQGASDVPAGASGAGFEMFAAAAGHSVFQSFNRTTSVLAPLHLYGTSILISNAAGTPTAYTILDLQSTTSAFMPPRMTTTQRDAMTAADGMILYNLTVGSMQYRKAGAWISI